MKSPLFVRPASGEGVDPGILEVLGKRAPKQALVLRLLIDSGAPLPLQVIMKRARASRSALRSLESFSGYPPWRTEERGSSSHFDRMQ